MTLVPAESTSCGAGGELTAEVRVVPALFPVSEVTKETLSAGLARLGDTVLMGFFGFFDLAILV